MGIVDGEEAVVGATLEATNLKPSGASVDYQWLRADAEDAADDDYTAIPGANSRTYKLAAADEGKYIKVKVTGKGSRYTGTAISEEAIGPVELSAEITAVLSAVNQINDRDQYMNLKALLDQKVKFLTLDLDRENYFELEDSRRAIVARDLIENMPGEGYTLKQLQDTFAEIATTRLVFQQSLEVFMENHDNSGLENIEYIDMLIENLEQVKHHNSHSNREIDNDILPELKGLKASYEVLTSNQQSTVLEKLNKGSGAKYGGSTPSSSKTRRALVDALADVISGQLQNGATGEELVKLVVAGKKLVGIKNTGLMTSALKTRLETLKTKLEEIQEGIDGRIEIGYVSVENRARPTKPCYLLGNAVHIVFKATEDFGREKVEGIEAKFYKEEELLSTLTLKDDVVLTGADNWVDGTYDVFGDYDSNSWTQIGRGNVTDLPTKVIVKVKFNDGWVAEAIKGDLDFSSVQKSYFFVEALNRTETAEEMSEAILALEKLTNVEDGIFTGQSDANQLEIATKVLEKRNEEEALTIGDVLIPNTAKKFFNQDKLDADYVLGIVAETIETMQEEAIEAAIEAINNIGSYSTTIKFVDGELQYVLNIPDEEAEGVAERIRSARSKVDAAVALGAISGGGGDTEGDFDNYGKLWLAEFWLNLWENSEG